MIGHKPRAVVTCAILFMDASQWPVNQELLSTNKSTTTQMVSVSKKCHFEACFLALWIEYTAIFLAIYRNKYWMLCILLFFVYVIPGFLFYLYSYGFWVPTIYGAGWLPY